LNNPLALLLRPQAPLWRYCLTVFPIALLPSAALFFLASKALQVAGFDIDRLLPPSRSASAEEFLAAVAFAPIAETLLLALVLRLLRLFTGKEVFTAIVSALAWGCLHGAQGFLWFFGTVWSFFVLSCAFLAWRERSFWHAFVAAAVPHALINATAIIVLAAENAA
jgi:membrane protease YdiL (CAAX protease family)